MSSRRAALLTAGYYAIAFGALGAYLPYWSVWLENWGLDRAEIGLFLGLATLSRIAGSMILTGIADRFAIRRWTITLASLASAAGFAAHAVIADQGVLMAATLLLAFVMAPQIPLGEALGLRASDRFGFGYAPVRAVGSLGFLAANIGLGWLLESAGPGIVPWVCAGGFTVLALFGALHPGGGSQASDGRARPGEGLGLLRDPSFRWFLAAAALVQASHGVFYVYATLAWRDQGIGGVTIGWLWAFGVIVETGMMLGPGRSLVARLGPAIAIALGGAAGVLRWSVMATEPSLAWLWLLQALHAVTFALAHLGAMAFLASNVPDRLLGTAQGWLSATGAALSSAAAIGAGATLIAWYGTPAGYLLAAAFSAIGMGAAIALAGRQHSR